MALTTPPAAGANSYISLADANTYFGSRLNSGVWTAASDANREAALQTATRRLDAEDWIGEKADTLANNALRWPRSGVENPDGQSLSSSTVPTAIQYATAELAIQLLDTTVADAPTTEVSVGDISLKFGEAASASTGAYGFVYSSLVESLIAPYRRAGTAGSLVRA